MRIEYFKMKPKCGPCKQISHRWKKCLLRKTVRNSSGNNVDSLICENKANGVHSILQECIK